MYDYKKDYNYFQIKKKHEILVVIWDMLCVVILFYFIFRKNI